MDPRDVADGVIRLGGIGYPQRSSIVSGCTLSQQWDTCSNESSHQLAEQVLAAQREEEEQITGADDTV
jgi:hypothetical protein